jgi:hypothetical protein
MYPNQVGLVDLGVGRVDVDAGLLRILAEHLPVLALEEAAAEAVADHPVGLGGVARGDEEVGLVDVQRVDERLGGVGGARELLGLAAFRLPDHLVLDEFVVPHALLHHLHGKLGAASDLADHERFGVPGDGQGVRRVVAREDPPEGIRVRVAIELASEFVDLCDELPRGLGRRGDETGVARELLSQRRQNLGDGLPEREDLAPVLRLECIDDLGPVGVGAGLLGHDDGIVRRGRGGRGRRGILSVPRLPAKPFQERGRQVDRIDEPDLLLPSLADEGHAFPQEVRLPVVLAEVLRRDDGLVVPQFVLPLEGLA